MSAKSDLLTIIRRFLGLRLLLPTLILFALATVLIGLEQKKVYTREQLLFSRIMTANVESFLRNARLTLRNLAVLNTASASDDFILHMVKMHRLYPHFSRLAWIDAGGTVIADIPSSAPGDDVSGLIIWDTPSTSLASMSAPYISPHSGELTVALFSSMPMGGMIMGELSLASLQETVSKSILGQGGELLLFITDAYGNVLAHPDQRLVASQANFGHLKLVRKAHAGQESFAGLERIGERVYLAGVSRIPDTGWLVAAAKPASDIVLALAANLVLILLGLVALFSIIIYRLNRKLLAQVVEPLGRFTGAVALLQRGEYGMAPRGAMGGPAFRELRVLQAKFSEMITAISEREQSLTEKAEEQTLLLDNIDLQVWFLRGEDLYGAVNRAHADFSGRGKTSIARRRLIELFPPDDAARFARQNGTVFRFREPVSYSSFQADALGRERILRIRMIPKLNHDGLVEYVICTGEDITERVAAEKRLRKSEELFRGIFESVQDVYYQLDAQARITLISPSVETVLGYTPAEVMGRHSKIFWIDPQVREDYLVQLRKVGFIGEAVILLRHKDGRSITASTSCRVEFGPDGHPSGVSGVIRDITERKQAEDRLRASLMEKEVMLKEIHHRVKNNLQVISSLLHLQSDTTDNPEAAELFAASQNRIMSMAFVHEELYKSRDLGHINLKDYATRLATRLVGAMAAKSIGLDLCLQDAQLAIDQAVPCGIILNELISNALKHAFADRDQGRIAVTIALDRDVVRLMVSDDGRGVPARFDLSAPSGLGLQLVQRLAGQLRGKADLDPGPGACFRIEFPLQDGRKNPADAVLSQNIR